MLSLSVARLSCLGDGGSSLMREHLQLELAGSYWQVLLADLITRSGAAEGHGAESTIFTRSGAAEGRGAESTIFYS